MNRKHPRMGFLLGVGMTLAIAVAAKLLAQLPFLSIVGQLVIAIFIGMAWRASVRISPSAIPGTNFSSKKLLRLGIILLGMRLNFMDIFQAGPKVFSIAVINIVFAFLVVYTVARLMKLDQKLGILAACGTAICGAAAIVAISPQIKAKDEETALGVATIAIMGTLFTLVYTLIYPLIGLSPAGYGIYSGATLHEIAHVIAAAAPGGDAAVDLAVIVKLTRVALLVPVAIFIGLWASRKSGGAEGGESEKFSWKSLPIPWFIFGFLAVSAVNSLGIFSETFAGRVVTVAYLLIAMAMAGLGLNVNFAAFRRFGLKSLAAVFVGSVLLSLFGYMILHIFQLV